MDDAPSERQQFKLLPPSEREYVEFSSEKLKEYNKNTVLQYNNRIRYRATNAIKEIAWLCDKLPDDQSKKIFSNESIENLLKIQEKALAVSEYTLGEEYEAEIKLSSGETVKAKRGKGRSVGNCWRLEVHMDKEIDALVFNTRERNILKKYIRCPGELIDLIDDLWEREHRVLQLEHSGKLITEEEYGKQLDALHDKLGELYEPS